MPGAGDIGYYTLPVIPSFRGIESSTQDALNRAFAGSGKSVGDEFNKAAKGSISSADIMSAAYTKLQASHDKAADAAGRYKAQYAALQQLQSSGATEARVVAAQERAASAYRKSQAALKTYTSGIEQYNAMKGRLVDPGAESFFSRLRGHLAGSGTEARKLGGELGGLAGKMGGFEVGTASLGRFGGVVSELTGLLGGAGGAALGLTAGIGTIVSAAVELEKQAYSLGSAFDKTFDHLRIQTGQTGAGLQALEQTTMAIAKRSPESISEIGNTVAAVSRGLHLTGRDLEAVSHQLGTLGRLTGEQPDVRRLGQMFRGFGISDANQEQAAIDSLFRAYQQTGIGVNELVDTLAKGHTQFKDFHLDLGQSAALLTTMQSGGLDSTKAISGLNIALGHFAAAGQDPAKGLADTVQQVRNLIAAGNDPAAHDLVNKIFGVRTGDTMFDQIKSGALDLANLQAAASNTGDTVAKAAADTDDWAEKWQELKNQVKVSIEPMALAVFNFVNKDLEQLSAWVPAHQGQIIGFFTMLGTQGVSVFAALTHMVADFVQAGADLASVLGKIVGGYDRFEAAGQRLFGHTELADKLDAEADAAFKWGEGLDHTAQNLYHAEDAIKGFGNNLQALGDRANSAAQFTQSLGDAAEAVSAKGQDVVIDIKDNTPEVREKLEAIHVHLEAMANDPTHLKLVPDTPDAAAKMEAFRSQQLGLPVNVKVEPTIDPAAAARMFDSLATMAQGHPMPTPFQPTAPAGGDALAPPFLLPTAPTTPHADGAVYGGRRGKDAHIMPSRPGFVQWAEPSTHGEAYIPFDGSSRSSNLWLEAGRRMGMVGAFDTGGVTPASRGGSTTVFTRLEQAADRMTAAFTKTKKGITEFGDSFSSVRKGDIAGAIEGLNSSVKDLKPATKALKATTDRIGGSDPINVPQLGTPGRPRITRDMLRSAARGARGADYVGTLGGVRDLGEHIDALGTDTGLLPARLPGLGVAGQAADLGGHARALKEHIKSRNAGGAASAFGAGAQVAEDAARGMGFDVSHITQPAIEVAGTMATTAMTLEGLSTAVGVLSAGAGAAVGAIAGPAALLAGAYALYRPGGPVDRFATHYVESHPDFGFDPTQVLTPQARANRSAQQAAPQQLADLPNPLAGPRWEAPAGAPPGVTYTASPGSLDPFSALLPAGGPGAGLNPAGVIASRGITQAHGPAKPTTGPPSPFGWDMPGSQYGGPVNGSGRKGQDSVLMWGAPGEHMFTADEVDAAGGHSMMYQLRAAIRAGALRGYAGGGQVGGAGGMNELARYVSSMNGTPYSNGSRTDCSGMASRIANVALGLPPVPSFTTRNEGQWLAAHGFKMGLGPPGTLRIGWYNHGSGTMDGHTAVTLPWGDNAESGGSHGGFLVGAGAAGADNPEFDQHAWLPQNPQGTNTVDSGSGGYGGPGSVGGGGRSGTTGPSSGGSGGAGGGPDMGELGNIGSQFLKDTFGFGDLLPDPSSLPPVQFLMGFLNSFLGGGKGGSSSTFGMLGGMLAGHPAGGGGGDAGGPDMGTTGPITPEAGLPGMPGPGTGPDAADAAPPQNVDQSMTVNVTGYSDTDMLNRWRREVQWAPRVGTYTPPTVTGGG